MTALSDFARMSTTNVCVRWGHTYQETVSSVHYSLDLTSLQLGGVDLGWLESLQARLHAEGWNVMLLPVDDAIDVRLIRRGQQLQYFIKGDSEALMLQRLRKWLHAMDDPNWQWV